MSERRFKVSKERKCSECAACCTVVAVDDLGKPCGTACSKLRPGTRRCSIYQLRPTSCVGFKCLWLLGAFGVADRPDHAGVVFDIANGAKGSQVARCFEVRAGASESGRGAQLLAAVARQFPVSVLRDGVVLRVHLPDGRVVSRDEHEASASA
jgi:hypothetical protein